MILPVVAADVEESGSDPLLGHFGALLSSYKGYWYASHCVIIYELLYYIFGECASL